MFSQSQTYALKQTDGQTDRQTDRQMDDKQTQTDRLDDNRQVVGQTN